MPKLNIKTSFTFDTQTIERVMEELSGAVSKSYGCSPEHVWVSWEHEIGKRWLFEGDHYLENQLAYIDFELSCFKASAKCSIQELMQLVNARIAIALPDAHVFGRYCELKPGEAILNEKILMGGV